MLTRRRFIASTLAAGVLLFVSPRMIRARELAPVNLKVQALPIGTAWYIFGAAYSKVLQENLPKGSVVDVVAKGGGVANIIAIQQKKSDVALANLVSVLWALDGDRSVFNGKKYQDVRALAGGLNKAWLTPCVRRAFLEETGQKTLEEVFTSGKPVRVVMKPRGATAVTLALKLIESLGSSPDKIKADGGAVMHVSPEQAEALMRDGKADIYFEATQVNHPTVSSIALTTDVCFPDLPQRFIDAQKTLGMEPSSLPKNFKGQEKDLLSFDQGTVLLVHKDMPESLAYFLTKQLCEHRDEIAAAHKAWEDFVPEKGWLPENTGAGLHPGAARYYRERGWMK